jgi:hypothetical protein
MEVVCFEGGGDFGSGVIVRRGYGHAALVAVSIDERRHRTSGCVCDTGMIRDRTKVRLGYPAKRLLKPSAFGSCDCPSWHLDVSPIRGCDLVFFRVYGTPASRVNRQFADAVAPHPRQLQLRRLSVPAHNLYNPKQPRIHGIRRLITESKDNDARRPTPRRSENVSEIKIECEYNSSFASRFRGNLGLGKTNEVHFP